MERSASVVPEDARLFVARSVAAWVAARGITVQGLLNNSVASPDHGLSGNGRLVCVRWLSVKGLETKHLPPAPNILLEPEELFRRCI